MHIHSRGTVTGFLARKAAIHSELGLSWTYQVSYSFFALQRLLIVARFVGAWNAWVGEWYCEQCSHNKLRGNKRFRRKLTGNNLVISQGQCLRSSFHRVNNGSGRMALGSQVATLMCNDCKHVSMLLLHKKKLLCIVADMSGTFLLSQGLNKNHPLLNVRRFQRMVIQLYSYTVIHINQKKRNHTIQNYIWQTHHTKLHLVSHQTVFYTPVCCTCIIRFMLETCSHLASVLVPRSQLPIPYWRKSKCCGSIPQHSLIEPLYLLQRVWKTVLTSCDFIPFPYSRCKVASL